MRTKEDYEYIRGIPKERVRAYTTWYVAMRAFLFARPALVMAMRAARVAAIVLVVPWFLVGCGVNQQFVGAVDGYAKAILPEYEKYVTDDTTLDADSKRIRLQTSTRFKLLIEEAKK